MTKQVKVFLEKGKKGGLVGFEYRKPKVHIFVKGGEPLGPKARPMEGWVVEVVAEKDRFVLVKAVRPYLSYREVESLLKNKYQHVKGVKVDLTEINLHTGTIDSWDFESLQRKLETSYINTRDQGLVEVTKEVLFNEEFQGFWCVVYLESKTVLGPYVEPDHEIDDNKGHTLWLDKGFNFGHFD